MFYEYKMYLPCSCVWNSIERTKMFSTHVCFVIFLVKAFKSGYFSIVLCAISSRLVELWPRPFVFRLMISGVLKITKILSLPLENGLLTFEIINPTQSVSFVSRRPSIVVLFTPKLTVWRLFYFCRPLNNIRTVHSWKRVRLAHPLW